MQTATSPGRQFLTGLSFFLFFQFAMFFQSCKKTVETLVPEEIAAARKKPTTPPQPPTFYFTNCNNPTYSASFPVGMPANVPITKNYINSPGGSYAAFTSATVNGITISAPAGTFNAGSGFGCFHGNRHPGRYGLL